MKNIEISNTVISIGNEAFYECTELKNITFSSNITFVAYNAFFACDQLESINVDNGNEKYTSENGVLFNKGKTEIIKYPSAKSDIAEYIIPDVFNPQVADVVAKAVADEAVKLGISRI